MSDVKIIAGPKTWIEGDAVQQLKKSAELLGMVRAVGMPDLWGRLTPFLVIWAPPRRRSSDPSA